MLHNFKVHVVPKIDLHATTAPQQDALLAGYLANQMSLKRA